MLIGIGDSLTQGTMDATNNATNTLHAYLQRVADSLAQRIALSFSQPLFDERERRLMPFQVPTNLGVDGADAFSVEGVEYYKRAGVEESFVSGDLLADKPLPITLIDDYDKVLYPINVLAGHPVSQIDSAVWLINHAPLKGLSNALVVFWVGNNDSSAAALGLGGKNPTFLPLPLEQIAPEIDPILLLLLRFGQKAGALSFESFTSASIARNLTLLGEFAAQYKRLLDRLKSETASSGAEKNVFLLTLPYYTAVGYLFDSEDIEYYLRKISPSYSVPPSFKRVSAPGEPIVDPFKGDRISLFTFGLMYALLESGYPESYVNQVLETDGRQRDDMVLSEEEQRSIMSRIDGFNAVIKAAALTYGPGAHVIDIGRFLNDALTGKRKIIIGGRELSRKWIRGNSFTFDGVHPAYAAQAMVANFVIARMNQVLGLDAPLHDLNVIMADDPYVDRDGDGWASGPDYQASGLTDLLFLFKDPDDGDPSVQVTLPPDVWEQISHALLKEILDVPLIRAEANRLGLPLE